MTIHVCEEINLSDKEFLLQHWAGGFYINGHYMILQIGKTKVFLRAGQMAELDARRTEVLSNAAKAIQRRIRTHNAHKQFIALRKAAIDIQSLWRGEPSENSKAWVDFVTSCTAIFIYYVLKQNYSYYKENSYCIGFYPLFIISFSFSLILFGSSTL